MEKVTSLAENSSARLRLITKVRMLLSLNQEKHVQISFLMEKACYHVQLPQRPSMDLQKKFLDYHILKAYSLLISSEQKNQADNY